MDSENPANSPETNSRDKVYISYNVKNSDEAFTLAGMLREEGIETWMTEKSVLPGQDLKLIMEEARIQHSIFLILFGSAGIGPSQGNEIDNIINLSANSSNLRIIPVLLPSSDPDHLPGFLQNIAWVDFRDGLDNEQEFQRLLSGIRGIPLSSETNSKSVPQKKVSTKTTPPHASTSTETPEEESVRPSDEGVMPSFKQLSPSARMVLNVADGIRLAFHQNKLHMEHLIFALCAEKDGPAQKLMNAAHMDEKRVSDLIVEFAKIHITAEETKTPSSLTALPPCSGHARAAIVAAGEVAKRVGAKRIGSRHLLYGALSVDKCSLIANLQTNGKLKTNGLRKEDVEIDPPQKIEQTIARLNSDDPDGEDQLDIMRELEALCAILAAEKLTPPLSIGLFGDWGSGKSFFMRKMEEQIEEYKKVAREAGGKSAFCPDIVQLKFNAWHYIDTNLWASLTSKIFEGLAGALAEGDERLADEKAKEYELTRLRAEKAVLEQQLAEAEQLKRWADDELKESEQRLNELEDEAQTIETNLSPKKLILGVVSFAGQQPEVMEKADEARRVLDEELGKAAKQFDIPKDEATTEVRSKLLELRGNWARLRAIWMALRKSDSRWLMLALLLASAVAATVIAALIQFSALRGSLAPIISAIMGAVAFLLPYYRKAQKALDIIEGALKQNEVLKEEAKQAKRKSLEETYEDKQKKAEEAQKKLERKTDEVKKKDEQLQKLSINGQIANFIKQRNQSRDYTRYLGVISRARNDFEQLSILLERQKLDNRDPLLPRIDRIILYIDDLDRCPEDKVVDVLQAVHLLLAFPLFIVVVGVDSRWLLHSLREHLKVFQSDSSDNEEMPKEERTHWQSTPLNYLEKIFQIPYTLRPMQSKGFGDLVDNLAVQKDEVPARSNGHAERPVEIAVVESKAASASTPAQEAVVVAGLSSPTGKESTVSNVSPAITNAVLGGSSTSSAQTYAPDSTAKIRKRTIDPNPQYLKIEKWERDLMKQLFEMIPSPRAAKRFINIYRLLRASVEESERQDFIGNEKSGKHRAALLLLAILTGYPAEATEILRDLLEETHNETWWDFIEGFRKRTKTQLEKESRKSQPTNGSTGETNEVNTERWEQLMSILDKIKEKRTDELGQLFEKNQPSDDFVELAPHVARYSFQSGRVLLEYRAASSNN